MLCKKIFKNDTWSRDLVTFLTNKFLSKELIMKAFIGVSDNIEMEEKMWSDCLVSANLFVKKEVAASMKLGNCKK